MTQKFKWLLYLPSITGMIIAYNDTEIDSIFDELFFPTIVNLNPSKYKYDLKI